MFDFLSKRFGSIFDRFNRTKFSESNLKETLQSVTESLLEADVPYDLAQLFVNEVQKEVIGQKVITALKPGEQFIKIVHDRLIHFLGGSATEFALSYPAKLLVMGLQGSGKTTSIVKVVHHLQQIKKKKIRIMIASVDFYRPAAIDQLEQLAKKVDVDFYRSPSLDPVNATVDICKEHQKGGYDLLILDTAGRLHIDNTMLSELREIKQLLQPAASFLMLDAMTGQESLNVAKAFDQAVGFEYAMLTKMDSDTRGGAAFSFRYALKKPIVFVGVGEKVDDIEEFKPERMAGRILDMGDIVTLAERAERHIKKSEQEELYDSMSKGQFSLDDFAKQMDMMNKLGSMSSLMKYLPGMGSISEEVIQKGAAELKKFRAIIGSMTRKERKKPAILDNSRKLRVARGSGMELSDVNLLLTRFEESQQYVKLFSKYGGKQGFFR